MVNKWNVTIPELTGEETRNAYIYLPETYYRDYEKRRAVAFLTFKHGCIDWLESNNEYWLERDARLRTDFNIKTGFQRRIFRTSNSNQK